MALILCLETATEVCSVGLSENGTLLAMAGTSGPMDHAARLTSVIASCLEQAGKEMRALDAVAVSHGPGSYTSLRIGYSSAKGIAYALGVPIIEIDTLQALALRALAVSGLPGALCCAMLDARRMEAYYAFYSAAGAALTNPVAGELTRGMFDSWYAEGKTVLYTGNAAEKFSRVHQHPDAVFLPLGVSAETFPVLAEKKYVGGIFADTAYCGPLYLKPPNITQAKALI